MSTPHPDRLSQGLDITAVVLFFLAIVGGIASFILSSYNGLAAAGFVLTVVGVFIKISALLPGLVNRFLPFMKGILPQASRLISIALLLIILVFQVIILILLPPPTFHPTNFSVTAITLKNGKGLPLAQPVSIPVEQLPLTITGTYSSQGSGHMWVVVEDVYGQYYLQITPVQFADGGAWSAPNVNTNVGTRKIDFVSVTSQGQSIFSFMAQAKSYGAFTSLPDGSKIVQAISIQVAGVLITAPTNASTVLQYATVQGTASHIPEDEELWLFVLPSDKDVYFPQLGPIPISGEQWSVNVQFGDASTVGLTYTLIPVLINKNDKDAHDAIHTYFQQQPPGPYKGIQLTSGMQLIQSSEVTVRR